MPAPVLEIWSPRSRPSHAGRSCEGARCVGAPVRWLTGFRTSGWLVAVTRRTGRNPQRLDDALERLACFFRHQRLASTWSLLGRGNLIALRRCDPLLLSNLNRMRTKARYCWDVHIGVRHGHKLLPDGRCHLAARRTVRHRPVVVSTDPDATHVLARETDKPDVLGAGTRARFPGDMGKLELSTLACPFRHHLVQHLVHLFGHLSGDDLRSWRLVPLAAVNKLSVGRVDLEDGIGQGQLAAICESRHATYVLEWSDACVSKGHRASLLNPADAKPLGHLAHLLAADGARDRK